MQDPRALTGAITATLDEPPASVPTERLRAYRDTEAVDSYVRLFERVLAARRATA